jgi:GT2 family glycosyltransferase
MNNQSQNPLCAVIILNWNGAKLLRRFLPSVVANTNADYGKVIVADNGSTDESLQVLSEEFPDVEVIKFVKNYGFAGGYNHAIKAVRSKYKYVVLLNSDVETPQGWLEPLVEFLESHPEVGAVQPKLLSYNQKDMFEYAGASGGFLDCNGYPYCRGRIFANCERDNGQYNNPISIFWATGAALTVRTELYLNVGGLDEDFFAHMEEIDLCWRILLNGEQIMVVPQSHVYHLGGGSLPASNPRKTYLNFRNNLLLLHKNLPDSTRTKKLLRRRLLDTIAWAKFVATFDFANASAVWRAHRDFATMRKKYTSHPDVDLLDTRSDTHRNILVDYYMRGKRTF